MKTYEPDERRTIDELITLYDLEPTIHDVFVEGSTDVGLLTWFLDRNGIINVNVYEINCINIPTSLLIEHGLPDGNRSRVITLALELCAVITDVTGQFTCIADKDFDSILARSYYCEDLLFTDYTCLEMFLFDTKVLQKFFDVFLLGFLQAADTVLETMHQTLQEVFLVRLANEILQLNTGMTDFTKCCTLQGETIHFNAQDLLTRFLHNGKHHAQKATVLETITHYRQRLDTDVRHQIHGHDFMELLSWYLAKRGVRRELYPVEVVSRSLFCCLEIDDLQGASVFSTLLRRLSLTS